MTKPQEFISTLAPHARQSNRRLGIPASISLAQAILESGWGRSQLAQKAKNLFGIKAGRSWTGPVIELPTKEFRNGQWVTEVARWRVYESYTEAFIDHGRLFYNGLYDAALPHRSQAKEFLQRIAPVYATDPRYAEKVWNLVTTYKLHAFDLRPSEWALDPKLVPSRWYKAWADLWAKENKA